jgi:histidyl-tRNA synthetase
MSTADYQPIQGMSDLGPPEVRLWQRLEEQARRLLQLYGLDEVRTPLLEKTPVFLRSLGDTTDVVQKEMYTFADRGGRSLTLRPEGTAGVIRYVASQGPEAREARLYYIGPMFRSERPQAGRRRQFHQVGVELLGPPNPAADAEALALQMHLLAEWGLDGAVAQINTRGAPEDHPAVKAGLRDALRPRLDALCEDCRRRYDENVLRVLDCKQPGCRDIVSTLPPVTEWMSADARRYLDDVLRFLQRLNVPVQYNPRLVRGFDYYLHTVWEITHSGLGAQDSLSGGGRYRIQLGDQAVDGVGFALGMERIIAALRSQGGREESSPRRPLVWLVSLGAPAIEENLLLAQGLRLRGVRCRLELGAQSLKAQLRSANRAEAAWVVIRGDQEIEKGTFQLKNMADGAQVEIDMPELMERLTALRVHDG